jgi:hypothetical protein
MPRLYIEDQLPLRKSEVLRRQIDEYKVGVRWPPAYEDMSPEGEERPLLEVDTKQLNEDRD